MAVSQASTGRDYWVAPLLFAILFMVYYITAQPLMDDSDVPWHLATGKLLLDTHRVPTTDPWSFASAGQPWYLLSWIWDAILGLVERGFGLFGVLCFVLMVSAGCVAMLASQLVTMRVSLSAVFFTTMVAGLCIQDFITARPHLAGYAFSFVFYMLLYRSRPAPSPALPRKGGGSLYWLPPLMLVWANTHGSFIAGFTVMAAYVAEAFIIKDWRWLKRLILTGLACGVMALINPYGLEVTIGALKTLNGTAKSYTIEWLPFTFSSSTGISTWLILFILASNLRFAKVPIADKLLSVMWLLASMFIIRNGAIFVLLSAPYLARCMDEATMDLREERKPSQFVAFMERRKLWQLWAASFVAVLAFSSVASKIPHEDKIISDSTSAFDAIDYAVAHYPDHTFLSNFNFGGQVIYRAGGKLQFMMDSRAGTVYPEQAIQDYLQFLFLKPGWQDMLKGRGINGIIMYKTTNFSQTYDEGKFHDAWQLVFAGKAANVYIARP